MWSSNTYELLDFGKGRKLEQVGGVLLNRPCPAAEGLAPAMPHLWREALSKYDRFRGTEGAWRPADCFPEPWQTQYDDFAFELRPTPFGHVGLFPEQATNWEWIAHEMQKRQPAKNKLQILNLFAYTGGSSLAAAAAGGAVVHVDAAKSTVQWAKENASLSRLDDRPIRWIVDDAMAFVEREIRRGNQYDAIILDPPSYGHGPKGKAWKIADHLAPLLSACAKLTINRLQFISLSCHSPGLGPKQLERLLIDAIGHAALKNIESMELALTTQEGRALPCGACARASNI